MICELNQTVTLGEGAGVGTLVLGNVQQILLSKKLDTAGWKQGLTPEQMDNVGRMGADLYSKTTERFRMPRATVQKK